MEIKTKDTVIPENVVDIWQRLVDIIAQLLGSPSVMINRLDPPELRPDKAMRRASLFSFAAYLDKLERAAGTT